MTSRSDDGCYVSAWVWVKHQSAEEIAGRLVSDLEWVDGHKYKFVKDKFRGIEEENVWVVRERGDFIAFGMILDDDQFELHVCTKIGGSPVYKITGERYANAFNDRFEKHRWDGHWQVERD